MEEIISIQQDYINIVETYFLKEIDELKTSRKNIDQFVIERLSQCQLYISGNKIYLHEKIINCVKELDLFWDKQGVEYNLHIKEIKGNSVTIEGYPFVFESLQKYATYFDYVIIRDIPFYNNLKQEDSWSWESLTNPFKYLLSILLIKEYIVGLNPFIIIGSTIIGTDRNQNKYLSRNKKWLSSEINKSIYLSENIKKISSNEFLQMLNPGIIEKYSLNPLDKLYRDMTYSAIKSFMEPNSHVSRAVRNIITKSIIEPNLNEVLLFNFYSESFNTTFAYNQIQWPFYESRRKILEKMLYAKYTIPNDLLIAYSFQNEFKWLSDLSLLDVANIRNEGFLEEMKSYFGKVISKINQSMLTETPDYAKKLNDEFVLFLKEKSKEFEINQNNIRRKAKLTKVFFGTSVSLSITSLAIPAVVPISLVSLLFGITFGKNLLDLIDLRKDIKKLNILQKSPAAMMIKYIK